MVTGLDSAVGVVHCISRLACTYLRGYPKKYLPEYLLRWMNGTLPLHILAANRWQRTGLCPAGCRAMKTLEKSLGNDPT